MTLRGFQRRVLRARAHSLRPIVQVGKQGLAAGLVEAVEQALDAHELIKIRVAGERDERRQVVESIAEHTSADVVGIVGGVATLFRCHQDPEKRQVALPTRPGGSG